MNDENKEEVLMMAPLPPTPLYFLQLNDEYVDLSHLNIKIPSNIELTGVLLFHAFKEIKRLSDEIKILKDKNEHI